MGLKVAVLMGGMSAEREVSLESGSAVAAALRELGHLAVEVDVSRRLAIDLDREKPDVAMLVLHGRGGEDGTVQGLLEIMRIPYTGCSVLASAVTIDKITTKEVLAYHAVPLVEDVVVERGDDLDAAASEIEEKLSLPVMLKPSSEGSSIGVTMASNRSVLASDLGEALAHDTRVLVERFIDGRLLTVGLLGKEPRVLPVLEIRTTEGFYDFAAKYQPGRSEYEVPAKIGDEQTTRAQELALRCFRILGCEGVSRIDLMLEAGTEKLVVLEVNTIPGMTATSLLPKAAKASGMSFNDVVAEILDGARLKIDLAE